MTAATATLSERNPGRIGTMTRASTASWTSSGTPDDSRADHQDVVRTEDEVEMASGGAGGEQHEAATLGAAGVVEGAPAGVTHQGGGVEVVHPGAAQVPVGDGESGGLDQIDGEAETGGGAQQSAGILRNVGLIEGEAQVGHGAGRLRGKGGWGRAEVRSDEARRGAIEAHSSQRRAASMQQIE